MWLSRAARIRRTARARAAATAARREVALRCLAQAWRSYIYVSPHRTYIIQKCYFS